ncbi:HvfC/BufC N-terminal domain-containing protein [Mesobaculum littorinae]|uniref:HvfC/BufC N-terminal domain-containing protein n=1 Tax=Mesobaculum littorinae TaxID=2486419 RepID=UPI001F4050DF|nr:DNA-binding domain-containing protein [Mesobaculum littorinae]
MTRTAPETPPFLGPLLDPASPEPNGLRAPDGGPAGRRYDVYRNNVTIGLMQALKSGFPVLAQVLDDRFADLARAFVRTHPPDSPILQRYGAALPGFLETWAPARGAPWLADLARLELALRESYHAADAPPLPPEVLANVPPDRLMTAHLQLAPSLRLVRSRWPVLSLWTDIRDGRAPTARAPGEAVLILRPDYDPAPHRLAPGGATLLLALSAGQPLGPAHAAAVAAAPQFDLSALLTQLLTGKGLTGLTFD